MKHFTAILIAVSLIITMLSVSLVGAHTISDKSAANEAVGASNPAEEVGASNPAEEVGASRPADAAGATNPAEEAGATNPAEEVGASVPPQYNYDPINSINVRDAGKNYHLCGGGSAEMTKVTDRLYKYTIISMTALPGERILQTMVLMCRSEYLGIHPVITRLQMRSI